MKDTTLSNLRHVFTQFAAANRHCFAYEQKAKADKHPGVANLFKALTRSYSIQAASMLRTSGGIHDTKNNIRQALVDGLGSQITILPKYSKQAEDDGEDTARVALEWSQGKKIVLQRIEPKMKIPITTGIANGQTMLLLTGKSQVDF